MTALRLHLDPGTGGQAVAIHQFSRGHILNDANEWYPFRTPLRNKGLRRAGCDFEAGRLLLTSDSFGAAYRIGSDETAVTALILVRGAVWPLTAPRV
jgi:hypothetical protein